MLACHSMFTWHGVSDLCTAGTIQQQECWLQVQQHICCIVLSCGASTDSQQGTLQGFASLRIWLATCLAIRCAVTGVMAG